MPRQITIVLDEQTFVVPSLNIGQLQDLADIVAQPNNRNGLEILKIALGRASPKPDLETLSPTLTEIGDAVAAILKNSGLQKPDANPQLAVVAGTEKSG